MIDDMLGLNGAGKRIYRPFLLVILLFTLYLAYVILKPFAQPIILAVVLTMLYWPVHQRVLRLVRGREPWAAIIGVTLITLFLVIPALVFLAALFGQGVESVNRVYAWLSEGNLQKLAESSRLAAVLAWVQERLGFVDFSQIDVKDNLMDLSRSVGQYLLARGAGFLGNVTVVVTNFAIMIFLIFFFIKDGARMLERVMYLSPLPTAQEQEIFNKVKNVTRSVFLGSFLTALVQGLIGAVGLAIVGLPALFWGSVMAISSLIPIVGTALVWIPSVVYLVLVGRIGSAVFLGLWCAILVGGTDNFIRPYFMKGTSGMSLFYIFLAVIGGVKQFGLIGILYGPLIIGLAMVVVYIYGIEFKEILDETHRPSFSEDPL